MQRAKSPTSYEIGPKIRQLRTARRWTQAELAKALDLSQGRLSELERGNGSFTAEQLLEVLRLFNVPVDHFAPKPAYVDSTLQNTLARLGARHLRENTGVLPSERLAAVHDALRETLIAAESPRLITALAPVLVSNIDRVSLPQLWTEFKAIGLEQRLGWLIENTLLAIEAQQAPPAWTRQYRRASAVLQHQLERYKSVRDPRSTPDILDASLRSAKSIAEAQAQGTAPTREWNVVTTLRPEDFAEALRAAHEGT